MSLSTGFFIQTTFSLFKFDVRQIKHHTIDQDIVRLINKPKEL